MRLKQALLRVPRTFDVEPIHAELAQLASADWLADSTGGLGDAVLPLVSPGGAATQDYALAGPAGETAALLRCPALRDLLSQLGVSIGRSRIARLRAGTSAPACMEWSYNFFRRAPLCIPIATDPQVTLQCGDETAELRAGEVWRYDSARLHRLQNPSSHDCLHLIVESREAEAVADASPATSPRLEPYRFEVLTPAELAALLDELRPPAAEPSAFTALLDGLLLRWTETFARFGHRSQGELAYQDILLDFREQILPMLARDSAGSRAARIIDTMLCMSPPPPRRFKRPPARPENPQGSSAAPELRRPLFIVSAPRAGSTLLFDLVARLSGVFTLGGESHEIIRAIPELHPAARGYASDRLTAAEASPAACAALRAGFAARLVDRHGRPYSAAPPQERPSWVRFVEKTPANALRIPFLRAAFPDALWIYLRRDARENICSLVEGWRSRRFLSYRGMPGWPHRDWSFFLPPGWQALDGCSLVEIAAYQWRIANETIQEDLRPLPRAAVREVRYDELVRDPRQVMRELAEFADLDFSAELEATLSAALPLTAVTLSAPAAGKWRRHEAELALLLPVGTSQGLRTA